MLWCPLNQGVLGSWQSTRVTVLCALVHVMHAAACVCSLLCLQPGALCGAALSPTTASTVEIAGYFRGRLLSLPLLRLRAAEPQKRSMLAAATWV